MRNTLSIWRNPSTVASLDRLFEDIFDNTLAESTKGSNTQSWFSPACDVEETESNYIFTVELPGVKKEDIRAEVHNQQLTILGQRKRERSADSSRMRVREREYGEFRRVFALPAQVDADKIEANYNNGELTVVLPKSEASKPRQIQVGEGKSKSLRTA